MMEIYDLMCGAVMAKYVPAWSIKHWFAGKYPSQTSHDYR